MRRRRPGAARRGAGRRRLRDVRPAARLAPARRGAAVHAGRGSGRRRCGCGPATRPSSRSTTSRAASWPARKEEMTEEAYRRWLADYLDGRDSVLIASQNDDCRELSRRARADLIRYGRVRAGREAALQEGAAASAGDRIMARQNTRGHADHQPRHLPGRRGPAGRFRGRPAAAPRRHVRGRDRPEPGLPGGQLSPGLRPHQPRRAGLHVRRQRLRPGAARR